jgi:hypothetical protein
MAAEYNPENPILTLAGTTSGTAVGKDKYGVNDTTGLGPNGADQYISYDIVINSIQSQPFGDASVRDTLGLGIGGQYTAVDVKIGDYVSDQAGEKIFKITAISSKTDASLSCTIEDVGMTIARTRSDRNNSLADGTVVVIFELNDEGESLVASTQFANFAGSDKILQVEQYFKIYKPFQRFTLYPENTGSLEIGDFVTITGSGNPYTLVTASYQDTTIGTVADLYGGNNINIRPFNKIITNFDDPQLVSGGEIGATWYLSGSNNFTTSSENNAVAKFFQLTDSIPAQVTGSVDNTTFNETQYNLEINGYEVIAQDAGGSTLTIEQITSSINNSANITFVSSSIDESGGGFSEAYTLGPAGSGGAIGSLAYSPDVIIPLSPNTGPVGDYSSTATGEFSITHSSGATTIAFDVKPTYANALYASAYPVADEEQISSDIYTAAQSAGAPVSASYGANIIYIHATSNGTLTINNNTNDPFGSPTVGAGSGTGISTGTFSQPAIEKYLTLFREDGGNILIDGSWINTSDGAGIYSVAGTPPFLLMLEGNSISSGGEDDDWFIGSTFLTASKDIRITGSLLVTHTSSQDDNIDFLVITSGSYDAFKINNEGVAQFFANVDAPTPWATADYGGLYFQSSSVWAALD